MEKALKIPYEQLIPDQRSICTLLHSLSSNLIYEAWFHFWQKARCLIKVKLSNHSALFPLTQQVEIVKVTCTYICILC